MRTANLTLTVEKVVDLVNEGQMRFDNRVQRPFVWDEDRQRLLIDSVLRGHIIGAIVADKTGSEEDWYYDVLDGQQRMTSLVRFMNNELELQDTDPLEFKGKEYDVEGLTYEDLPEELQKEFRGYNVLMIYCEGSSQDEKSEMFRRLNNGKSLTSAQGILASIRNLEGVDKLGEHPVFEMLLTPVGKKSSKHVMYIAKIWTMLSAENLGDISFLTKDFYPRMAKVEMTNERLEEVRKVLDYWNVVVSMAKEKVATCTTSKLANRKILSAMKKEVHVASFVPFVKYAMDNNIPCEEFYRFANYFFGMTLVDRKTSDYSKVCSQDAAKTYQICSRHDIIEDEWNKWFKAYPFGSTATAEPTAQTEEPQAEESAKDSEPEVVTEETTTDVA